MAHIPPVPRRILMVDKGLVSVDWDRWFQQIEASLNEVQSHGVFATNAAALAGGLVIGQVYQTVTGELRVVV